MISHRESLRLLLRALFHSLSATSTFVFALVFAVWGFFGPPHEGQFANVVRVLDPYRYWLAFVLLLVSAHLATRKAVSDERQRVDGHRARVLELEERLAPRLEIEVRDCCHLAKAARIGVRNLGVTSVDGASVYVDIPNIVAGRVLAWAGMAPDESLTIHHGPDTDHHHTAPFVSVGDNPDEFWLTFGYPPNIRISGGRYEARLYLKARNMVTTTARVEIRCTEKSVILTRLPITSRGG